jgi:hypothetical protein
VEVAQRDAGFAATPAVAIGVAIYGLCMLALALATRTQSR